jgi:hypothetical protein
MSCYYGRCTQSFYCCHFCVFEGPSRSWSNGCWIYNYVCNQYLSRLKLWVRIPLRWGVLNTTLCPKVCQWRAIGQLFSPGTLVCSINKTDHINKTILLKVVLNTMTWKDLSWSIYWTCIYLVTYNIVHIFIVFTYTDMRSSYVYFICSFSFEINVCICFFIVKFSTTWHEDACMHTRATKPGKVVEILSLCQILSLSVISWSCTPLTPKRN